VGGGVRALDGVFVDIVGVRATRSRVVDGESAGVEVLVHGDYGGEIIVVLECGAREAGFD